MISVQTRRVCRDPESAYAGAALGAGIIGYVLSAAANTSRQAATPLMAAATPT
jgi:hypothetical protein